MHLSKNVNQIILIAVVLVLLITTGFFAYRVFTSIVKPFFLEKEDLPQTLLLVSDLEEAVAFIRLRGGLTVATPSATLIEEEETGVATAEVVNGSGVPLAAQKLADLLADVGVTVSQIRNSSEVRGTVVSLKDKSLLYKDAIVEKIGTESGAIRFETLEDSYPFDIRIVIGR